MTDYRQKYLKEVEENSYLKEDIQLLREKLEKLTSEQCILKDEFKILNDELIENKKFSKDGFKAVIELLDLLDKDSCYTYNTHKYKGRYYYKIYNINGLPIFTLENYTRDYSIYPGLLTTLEGKDLNNDYKQIYNSVTSSWYQFADYKNRKQYDIRGKKISDVMNILNKFK